MLKAAGTRGGAPFYILGLEPENLRRLANDEPILLNLQELGHPEAVWVALIGGEDIARLMAAVSDEGLTT